MDCPKAAERRAASRISVTMTLVSSGPGPVRSFSVQNHCPQVRQGIVIGSGNGFCRNPSFVLVPAVPEHIPGDGDGVTALAVYFHVFAVEGPVPGRLDDRPAPSDRSGRWWLHRPLGINFRLDVLRDGGDGERALAVHHPSHQVGAVTAEIKESAAAVELRIGEPREELRAERRFPWARGGRRELRSCEHRQSV